MNRPGQPQQRPPNITPNPGLTSSFRGPYPPYGMPPRNVSVLQGYVPGLQPNNHRTAAQQSQTQNMVPQPSPGFLQQRTQNSFAFGGPLGQAQGQSQQHQQSTPLQQHSSNPQLQSQLQQQQTNGTSSTLPPHLAQNAAPPSLSGTAPSVSSASEIGLDPNDFPALGSTPANNNNNPSSSNGNTGNGVTTSYASQAGTGVPLGGAVGTASGAVGTGAGGLSGVGSIGQQRDFTPDDFPALGGQSHTQTQGQTQNSSSHPSQPNQNQENHPHPPGLNGFQHTDHLQHRQSLLGTLGGTPGMLNLGPAQARSVHPGFQQGQTEAEKQQQRNNYALKLNQATHAAWNSPIVNPGSQSQAGAGAFTNATSATTTQQNGTHPNSSQSQSQPLQTPSQPQQHLNAPPGVPLPANSYSQQQQQSGHAHAPGAIANASAANVASAPTTYTSNGLAPGESHNPNSALTLTIPTHSQSHSTSHPQTPAQQILMSAADRWGLLGLLAMIKSAGSDVDQGLSSVGTDLGTMGLDMGYTGNLYSTFITPWADQSAAHTVEPDFHLPGCYNVQPPPPGPSKAVSFSDETLFFMFYSSPRDALQEVAAQELWNRNWRFHKDLRLWITKETGTSPSQKVPGGERGAYTFWDPDNWSKERKEMTVLYADLEEKSVPVFVHGPGLALVQNQQTQAQTQGTGQQTQQQQTQQQQQLQQSQVQQTQRGSFQMGL